MSLRGLIRRCVMAVRCRLGCHVWYRGTDADLAIMHGRRGCLYCGKIEIEKE